MILVKSLSQYSTNYVEFSKSMKNNVIKNSYFTRIFYSSPFFKLNGIYLKVNITNYLNENSIYHNNYIFNPNSYESIIGIIQNIEMEILNKLGISNKIAECDLYKSLISGNIKILDDSNGKLPKVFENFIIKISGIWENDSRYGLNYKFIRKRI